MQLTPEQLSDFVDRLARMETKLDQLRDDEPRTDARFARADARLDRVERFMWLAVGIATASAPASVAAAIAAAGTGG